MLDQTGSAAICVHAATATELWAARQALLEAGPIVAQRGTSDCPEQHCALVFPSTSSTSSSSSTQQADGSASSGPCGTFAAQQYMAKLDTRVLGRLLLTAAATTSTQVVVQENSAKLPDGLVFVADKQYGGKGRGSNRWESPDGCLMFTSCTRLAIPGQRLPFVQYIVSLAVVQAVQAEAAQRLQGGSIDVRIKWPNDVYAGGLKLGGILCHSSYRDSLFHLIIGVGLNLSNRQPATCVDALIEQAAGKAAAAGVAAAAAGQGGGAAAGGSDDHQLPQQQAEQERGQQQQQQPQPGHDHYPKQEQQVWQQQQQQQFEPVSRESLLAGILSRLEPMLAQLAAEGFAPFEREYCRHWLHSDQQVQLEEGSQLITVTIRGLSPNGYLLATNASGERYELHPDGNSLDFFRGLVRKKLPH